MNRRATCRRTGLVCQVVLAVFIVGKPGRCQDEATAAVQAQTLLREGKAEAALAILLDLHRSSPSNANLCQQIGVVYTKLNDLAHAEEFYRQAVQLDPSFTAARKNLGTVLWFLNRKEESEREFRVVTKAVPSDPVPHLYLGLAFAARHEFGHAKQEFERAGTLAFANPEVLQPVVESYLATHDLSYPTTLFQQLTHAESPDFEAISNAATVFLEYGQAEQAVSLFEKVIAAGKDSAVTWRLIAHGYDLQHKPDRAYPAYRRSLEMEPASEDGYLALADFASSHANNNYALEVTARGIQHVPQSAKLQFEQGILLSLTGDRAKAQASFSHALDLKPGWNLPLLALGVSALESGDAARAVNLFEKARAVDPQDARAHYLYALALSKKGSEDASGRTEAVAALSKAIEIDSKQAASHALLGHFFLAAGKPEQASAEWAKALRLDPENQTALYQLSLLRRRQGNAEEAERLLARFQQAKVKQRTEETQLVEILKVNPQSATPQ